MKLGEPCLDRGGRLLYHLKVFRYLNQILVQQRDLKLMILQVTVDLVTVRLFVAKFYDRVNIKILPQLNHPRVELFEQ